MPSDPFLVGPSVETAHWLVMTLKDFGCLPSTPPRTQQGLWADRSCAKGLLGPQCRPLARDHRVDRRKWHWKGRAHTS